MRRVLLGGGVMGESILAGMRDAEDGPDATAVVEKRRDRARELADRYPVRVSASPDDVVGGDTDVLVVAVNGDASVRVLRGADRPVVPAAERAALLRRLDRYPEVVASAAASCEPHSVATYLRELAGDFHTWYNAHKMLVEDEALPVKPVQVRHLDEAVAVCGERVRPLLIGPDEQQIWLPARI